MGKYIYSKFTKDGEDLAIRIKKIPEEYSNQKAIISFCKSGIVWGNFAIEDIEDPDYACSGSKSKNYIFVSTNGISMIESRFNHEDIETIDETAVRVMEKYRLDEIFLIHPSCPKNRFPNIEIWASDYYSGEASIIMGISSK